MLLGFRLKLAATEREHADWWSWYHQWRQRTQHAAWWHTECTGYGALDATLDFLRPAKHQVNSNKVQACDDCEEQRQSLNLGLGLQQTNQTNLCFDVQPHSVARIACSGSAVASNANSMPSQTREASLQDSHLPDVAETACGGGAETTSANESSPNSAEDANSGPSQMLEGSLQDSDLYDVAVIACGGSAAATSANLNPLTRTRTMSQKTLVVEVQQRLMQT